MGCGSSASTNKLDRVASKVFVADKDESLQTLSKTTQMQPSSGCNEKNIELLKVADVSTNSSLDEIIPQMTTELERTEGISCQLSSSNSDTGNTSGVCKTAMNFERRKFLENYNIEPQTRFLLPEKKKAHLKNLQKPSNEFCVGDYVQVHGYTGIIEYIGPTEFGKGEFIGVKLNRPHKEGNEGSIGNTSYFTCKPKCGLFVRPSAVFKHTEVETIVEKTELWPSTIVFAQTAVRRYLARRRLRKMKMRSSTEKAVDAHVLRTPVESAANTQQLATYLTEPWCEERYKSFAIYRWITFNIDYDSGNLRSIDKTGFTNQDFDTERVLLTRKSQSFGLSKLFEILCSCVNLLCHTVFGYIKEPDNRSNQPDICYSNFVHHWNLIRVNNKWYVCDVTRGIGHVRLDDFTFQRDLNSHYFLVEPERAIKDHFPLEERWQLLSEPVLREKFERLAAPSVFFNKAEMQLLSHEERDIYVQDNCIEIIFYAPRNNLLAASLENKQDTELGPRNMVQFRPCGIDQQKVLVQFPVAGVYGLEVFVKLNGEWLSGINYQIHASQGTGKDIGGFPHLSNKFHDLGFELEQPLENIQTSTGEVTVCLRCFNQRFASITGRLVLLTQQMEQHDKSVCFIVTMKKENSFFLEAQLQSPATYKVDIFAEYTEAEKMPEYLCSYFIDYSC